MLAKRLVEARAGSSVGLWIEREDGDWDVWNYGEKSAGATSSAERMRRLRARRKGSDDSSLGDTNGDVTKRHRCSTSTSTSISSGSDLEIASPAEEVTGIRPKAAVPAADPGKPPEWFVTAIGVIAMTTGVELPAGEAWLRYDGHRDGKGLARTQADAQYWLTTVMVPEQREALRRAVRDRERDAKFKPGGRAAEPDRPPPPTPEQAKRFAENLSARLLAGRKAAP